MTSALRALGQEVANELVALAISIITLRVLGGVYSRLVRATPKTSSQPVTPRRSTAPPGPDPVELGGRVAGEIKGIPQGKRAAMAQKISAAKLSQDDAVTAVGEASRVAFGRIAGTVKLPDGTKVVPSVNLGDNQPVMLIRPNGSVVPGRATIRQSVPLNVKQPIEVVNVRPE